MAQNKLDHAFSEAFGSELANVLKSKKMLTTELAKKIGVNPSTLYWVIDGRSTPSLTVFAKIVKQFPSKPWSKILIKSLK